MNTKEDFRNKSQPKEETGANQSVVTIAAPSPADLRPLRLSLHSM